LGNFNLSILYENTTASGVERLSGLGSLFLHILSFNLPNLGTWTLCLAGPTVERCFPHDMSQVRSLITSVPTPGNYSIFASTESWSGWLEHSDGESFFEVGDDGCSISEAMFVRFRSPSPSGSQSASPAASVTPTSCFTEAFAAQFGLNHVHRVRKWIFRIPFLFLAA
jgi:hypothetical protein